MFEDCFVKFSPIFSSLGISNIEENFSAKLTHLYIKHKELNELHNLTRITSEEEFFEKHFVDSLFIALVYPDILTKKLKIADIGCGGGFPCLPLALVNSSLDIVGIESLGKKVEAVNEIAQNCQLENLKVYKFRAREASRLPQFSGQFDIVTARAVATADELIIECRQFMRPDGVMLFYKTPEAISKELPLTEREAKKFNLKVSLSPKFTLSQESGERQFFIIKKG